MNSIFTMSSKITAIAKSGSLAGAVLLICGSSIGVGILALPVLTAYAGAIPTVAVFILCWLLMSITALLLLETRLALPGYDNLVSMSKKTLNTPGQIAVLVSFLFLFYSLITAYIAKGGEVVCDLLNRAFLSGVPDWIGPFLITSVSALVIYFGAFIVDHINRFFMAGLFAAYFFLTFSGMEQFEAANASHCDWNYALFIVPFIVTSFGYHNMLPTIHSYLGNDRRKLVSAIFLSGGMLLLIYSFWVVCFHGMIPLTGEISFADSMARGEIVTEPLARLISSPLVRFCAIFMAFFAIITSLLGQGLSILDFLADTFRVKKSSSTRLVLLLALFVPSYFFSQTIPGVFFKALELAGGVCAMALFGVIPALMAWVARYNMPEISSSPLVPGGKATLGAVLAASSAILLYEIVKNI